MIHEANSASIKAVVNQQFKLAEQVLEAGLVPIVEPEVTVEIPDKAEAEELLKAEILTHLKKLDGERVALKLTIPTVDNFYRDLIEHPNVTRVVGSVRRIPSRGSQRFTGQEQWPHRQLQPRVARRPEREPEQGRIQPHARCHHRGHLPGIVDVMS